MNIIYLAAGKADHSSTPVLLQGLIANGVNAKLVVLGGKGLNAYPELRKTLKAEPVRPDVLIVAPDMPLLVWVARLAYGGPIVYNALCSVYERIIISRDLAKGGSLKAFWYWLQDAAACWLAKLTIVESEHQVKFFQKLFKLPANKLVVMRTGVDEQKFFIEPAVHKFERFTALFRGRLLPEAGAEYLVKAAKLLEGKPIDVLMLADGQELPKIQKLIGELQPSNLELRTGFLEIAELRTLMQRCHLSLGQLSNHPRLERTIPHKAYETLVMELPYLTARTPGVLELLTDGKNCVTCNPADPEDLAAKISWAADHPAELDNIAAAGHDLYQKHLRPEQLAKGVLEALRARGN